MSYQKPEVVPFGSSMSAVQSSSSAKNGCCPDGVSEIGSTTAYEADE